MSHFSTALQIVLDRTGLPQSKLAEMAGVDAPLFSRYINGKYRPTPDFLEKLCGALADRVDRAQVVIGHLQDEIPQSADDLVRLVNLVGSEQAAEAPPSDEPKYPLPPKIERAFQYLRKRAVTDSNVGEAIHAIVAVLKGQEH